MALFNITMANLLSHQSTSGLLKSKRGVLGKTYKVHDEDLGGLRINRNEARQQYHQLPHPKSHVKDQASLPSYLNLLPQSIKVIDTSVEKATFALLNVGQGALVYQNQHDSSGERNGTGDTDSHDAHIVLYN